MRRVQLVLSAALLLSACASPKSEGAVQPAAQPAVDKHVVKIHRHFTKGQQLDVDVEAHQIARALVQGQEEVIVGLTEELRIHLVGDVTIDQVAEDGRAGAATLHVVSFVNPENEQVILPPDSIVLARRVDGVLMTELQGGTLSNDQKVLLDLAFPLERPGSRLGDELFGTPEPRAVGEVWTFNRGYVAEDLQEEGIASAETDLDGNVKLDSIVPCGKTKCLKLLVNAEAKSASLVAVEGASDVGRGELRSTIELQVPVDETTPVYLEDANTTLMHSATFKQGDQTVTRDLSIDRHRRATYTPK